MEWCRKCGASVGPYHPVLRPVWIPADGGAAADSALAAAIVGLCQYRRPTQLRPGPVLVVGASHSTPYHLAHGLLDYAETSGTWTVTRQPGP